MAGYLCFTGWIFNKMFSIFEYLNRPFLVPECIIAHFVPCEVREKVLHTSQVAHQAKSDLEYFYSHLDGMLVHHKVNPSLKFVSTHLYTWMDRGTVRVKCLAQEHNAMSMARAQTQTAH